MWGGGKERWGRSGGVGSLLGFRRRIWCNYVGFGSKSFGSLWKFLGVWSKFLGVWSKVSGGIWLTPGTGTSQTSAA